MDDRAAVAIALVVATAALAAVHGHLVPVPLAAGPVVVLAAVAVARAPTGARVALLGLGAALLAAALGQRSVAGLEAPLETGPVRAEVTLVGDPAPQRGGGVSVDVRLGGRRLRAVARSAAASALDERLAGEKVTVIGSVQRPGRYERLLRHRHIAGRLVIDTVTGWHPGDPASTAANGLRRTLAAGAEVLPERQRSLLAGLTLGDDRHQPADMVEAFRASGLSHLLAVSGQNVAFVLVVAAPLLTRLRFGPRLAATLGVLAAFALVTRAEPSVLRAVAMAGVAALGTALGRPASTVRALALGVTAMVLVDPLLTTSLGFRLSVLGAAGIVVGAERVERALPGPRWVAAPLSVTLAAQAAVAPLLVAAFGGVPVASVPANLLAAPAAGPIMVWGLTGGVVAGLGGGLVAEVVHLPTRVLLAWLDGVALTAARWPAAELRTGHLAALGLAAALVATRRRRCRGWTPVGWAVVAVTVLVAVAPARRPPGDLVATPLGTGATVWRSGAAVVLAVDGRADGDAVVADLRARRLLPIGVLVVRTASPTAAEAAERIGRQGGAAVVLVPRRSAAIDVVPRATVPARGAAVDVGRLRVTVIANDDTLEVEVGARAPPIGAGRRPRPETVGRRGSPGRAPPGAAIPVAPASTSSRPRRSRARRGRSPRREGGRFPRRSVVPPPWRGTRPGRGHAGPYPRRSWPSRRRLRCRPPAPAWRCPAVRSTYGLGCSWRGSSRLRASAARTRSWPPPGPWPAAAPTSSTSRSPPACSALPHGRSTSPWSSAFRARTPQLPRGGRGPPWRWCRPTSSAAVTMTGARPASPWPSSSTTSRTWPPCSPRPSASGCRWRSTRRG